jgi:ABC-type transport system substrate-binding protein
LAFKDEKFKPRGFFPLGLFAGPRAGKEPIGEERAKELLAAIGPPKTPLRLVYQGDREEARADAEKVGRVLGSHKIPVNLVPLKGQAGRAIAEAGDYDLWLGSRAPEIPSAELWLGRFLESSAAGRGNPAYFANAEADGIIQSFRASPARDQRERKVSELDLLAENETPYVFLYQKSVRFLADQRLAGQKTHPMWPEAWPIASVNLSPFKAAPPQKTGSAQKTPPETPVREFDEIVAEPFE